MRLLPKSGPGMVDRTEDPGEIFTRTGPGMVNKIAGMGEIIM